MTMAMKNPPRRTTIRGQKHLLAYITPEEADVLKAMGGSGEKVHGIPAFPPSERDSMGRDTGSGREGGSSGGGSGGGGGRSEDRDAAQAARDRAADRAREAERQAARDRAARDAARQATERAKAEAAAKQEIARAEAAAKAAQRQAELDRIGGLTPGQATAMFGDATMAGVTGFTSSDVDRMLESASVDVTGMLPELQRRARRSSQFSTLGKIVSPFTSAVKGIFGIPSGATSYDNLATLIGMPGSTIMSGGLLGPDAVLGVPTGGTGAFGTPAHLSQGYFGQIGYTGMPNPDYEGPFADLVGGYQGADRGGDGPEVVPTQTNPVTGQEECPEGYVFDEDLQACRMGGDLPMDYTAQPGVGPATGDLYGRMGLLDIAPTGLGMFKQRFGAGFGSPSEFDVANRAFRQSGGVMRPYQGYTLLS